MSDFKVKSAVPLIPVEITLEQDGKETVILAHVDMMGKKLHLKHDDDFQIAEMEKQVFGILIKPLPPVDIPEKAMYFPVVRRCRR